MELECASEDRIEKISQSIGKKLEPLLIDGYNELMKYFDESLETVVNSLRKQMDTLYFKVKQEQQKKTFGKLSYIRVFPRRTEIISGNYGLLIRLYDETGYENPTEIAAEWNPQILNDLFFKQLKEVEKEVNSDIFRITAREKQLVKVRFTNAFHFITIIFLTCLRMVFVASDCLGDVTCGSRLLLTYGDYMDDEIVIETYEPKG